MANYTQYYQLILPEYADVADVDDLNHNNTLIDNIMHGSQVSLAPGYDSTQTYNTGDVVMYGYKMYKCIADGVTGAWDPTEWEPTTASEVGGGGSVDLETTLTGNTVYIADAAAGEVDALTAEIQGSQSGSGEASPTNVRPIIWFENATFTNSANSHTDTVTFGTPIYLGTLDAKSGKITTQYVCYEITSVSTVATAYGLRYFSTSIVNRDIDETYRPICNRLYGATVINGSTSPWRENIIYRGGGSGTVIIIPPQTLTTVAECNQWLSENPLRAVFKLKTEVEISITPAAVSLLNGENIITTNLKSMSLTYKNDLQKFVQIEDAQRSTWSTAWTGKYWKDGRKIFKRYITDFISDIDRSASYTTFNEIILNMTGFLYTEYELKPYDLGISLGYVSSTKYFYAEHDQLNAALNIYARINSSDMVVFLEYEFIEKN